ncbi:hypothetical protein ABBQ38_005919 [Trebouxia sp. C0009 RCD-2024]
MLRVFQDALPGNVFQQIRQGLDQSAAFWDDHNYFEPQTPFFSYLYDLASAPNTTIEAAIQELHSLLLQSAYGPCLAEVTCAEWWAHCREPEEPHQLHFDLREAALRRGLDQYRLDHPVISSVLYLTAAGGPTVVLDQHPSACLAERGWLVQPCPNQLLAFQGNLLHGVIPGKPSTLNVTDSCERHASEKRITLIVAWWGPGMRAEPGAPGQGPCRLAPYLGAGSGSPVHRPSQHASCLKTKTDSLMGAETARSSKARPPQTQASPGLKIESSGMHSNITCPHACNQKGSSSSASVTNSDSEADTISEAKPANSPLFRRGSDSDIERCTSANSETKAHMSSLLWLQQCQLAPYQQRGSHCPQQQPHMTPATNTEHVAAKMCSSQSTEVSTAVFDRQATSTAGLHLTCQGPPTARGYSPPAVSPAWLNVSPHLEEEEARCDQTDTQQDGRQGRVQDDKQGDNQDNQQYHRHDDQGFTQQDDQQDDQQDRRQHDWQDSRQTGEQNVLPLQEGSQPAAKPHKQNDQDGSRSPVTHQPQLLVPLPPLRFFLRSADEIAMVYQPSIPSLVPAGQ